MCKHAVCKFEQRLPMLTANSRCHCAVRAIAYAISKGVTIIAAAGNDNVDLGHLSGMHDISSPNNGNPIARKISSVRAQCCCIPHHDAAHVAYRKQGPCIRMTTPCSHRVLLQRAVPYDHPLVCDAVCFPAEYFPLASP